MSPPVESGAASFFGVEGPLSAELREVAAAWARSQRRLVVLAAAFADSGEWVAAGSPTAAHWLAQVADVEVCTAREWIRIGRRLGQLPAIAAAFAEGLVSYSKVRLLTRIAGPENEADLVALARNVPAGSLGRALAAWLQQNTDPDELAKRQHGARSLSWHTEPDGMVGFRVQLTPLVAGRLIAGLTAIVMRSRPTTRRGHDASADASPTLVQQYADALDQLLTEGGAVATEVVVHVRGDGTTLDDGTPVPSTMVERIASTAFLRALIHDAQGRPINASRRRRHPDSRQKRVVRERDRVCVECGARYLLHYDHNPPFGQSGRTVVEELELRCAPCHRRRHRAA